MSGSDGQEPTAGEPVDQLTYTAASRELDSIVEFFEQRDVDVDELVARLERATAIVDELDRRIRRTRAQVEELVPRLEAVSRGVERQSGDAADRDDRSDVEAPAPEQDPVPDDELEEELEAWEEEGGAPTPSDAAVPGEPGNDQPLF